MRERFTTSCASIGWIPSEAMSGLMRLPLDVGLGHYDEPPPDVIDDVDAFVADGRCRFANHLSAWAEVEDGRIVDAGCDGGGRVASTDLSLGPAGVSIGAVAFPELRATETDGDRAVTFVQTVGARTGAPFPRRTGSGLRMKLTAPTAWSTVAVTIGADGTTSFEARGASPFPRHWFYDATGRLVTKSATIDYRDWTATSHEDDTPWGDAHREIAVAACETALERTLSRLVMDGGDKPTIRTVDAGQELMRQGEPATAMLLVLDGLMEIEVDGRVVAEDGPGSLLGERAVLEGGVRTATVRAVTAMKVAEFGPELLAEAQLRELSTHHRREHD